LNIDKHLIESIKNSGIWGIAIATAFVIGVLSANPVVEAAAGWKAAFDDLQQQINEMELLPGPQGPPGVVVPEILDDLDARITALENQPAPESQVYEVSGTTTILAGDKKGGTITLLCLDGDWMDNTDNINFVTDPIIFVPGIVVLSDSGAGFLLDPTGEASTGEPLTKRIGYTVVPELLGSGTPLMDPVDVTVTILCNSPSP